MAIPIILSIDEGTTNTKAIAVDQSGNILAKASVAVQLTHPHPGWAEQDPMQIWDATEIAIENCLQQLSDYSIEAIAISNQRESIVAWDKITGKPLSPIISWQCRRTEALCAEVAIKPEAKRVKDLTGSVIDPLFPASKISWILMNLYHGFEDAQKGDICVGTVDSWLVWCLTKGEAFATDYSNASRYQLFNIHTLSWDDELLSLYNVPKACLPKVVSSCGERGRTKGCRSLNDNIPILSQIGDSHGALYGQNGFNKGVVKATYGTGSSLMTCINKITILNAAVSTTIAWHDGEISYALEGNITHTGAAIAYMGRLLNITDINALSNLAQTVENAGGVYFVPALAGLGAPYWDADARGIICGLTDAATPATLARAGFEAVVYQIADLFFAMEKAAGEQLQVLYVDGGPTKNTWLMQMQADLLNRVIIRSDVAEVSALGAAYLAGKSMGWWKNYIELQSLPRQTEQINPNPKNKYLLENYKYWQAAVAQARFKKKY